MAREENLRFKAEHTNDEVARKTFIAEADEMLRMFNWIESPEGKKDIQETLELVNQITAYRGGSHSTINYLKPGATCNVITPIP